MKTFTKIAALAGACALQALLATSANASVLISADVGGAAVGSIRDNLDSLALGTATQVTATGITVSFAPDGGVVTGALSGIYAAPFLSNLNGNGFGSPNQAGGADLTNYLTAGGTATSSATLTFAHELKSVGLLWGSIDTYNTLLLEQNGVIVGTITGSAAAAAASTLPNGDQSTNGTAYVNITSDVEFNQIVALSTQHAFEFDNISYTAESVPEPVTLSLFGTGLAGAAALRRRKARKA